MHGVTESLTELEITYRTKLMYIDNKIGQLEFRRDTLLQYEVRTNEIKEIDQHLSWLNIQYEMLLDVLNDLRRTLGWNFSYEFNEQGKMIGWVKH